MGKTYRSMQGRQIDMEKLRAQNELMPAVGNMKVNARGDELGPAGKVVRTREQIMAEYYEANPNAAPDPNAKVKAETTQGSAVPPPQNLKIEDTLVSTVVEENVEEPKAPEMENETLAKVEEKVAEKTIEAVQRARRRRSGIEEATGEE
jgi:hypothetical protein